MQHPTSEVRSSRVTPEVFALATDDALPAAEVLARAFDDSPVYLAVLRGHDDRARGRALERVKHGFVKAAVPHGGCRAIWRDGRMVGVTLVNGPGEYPLSWIDEVRQATGCATTGPGAILRFLKLTAYMRERHPKEPHFYLFAIGVLPSEQGHGLGRALLAELHERADEAGAPTYLETEKPLNVRLYESVGYRVVTDEVIPGLGVRMWTMQRDPRARAG